MKCKTRFLQNKLAAAVQGTCERSKARQDGFRFDIAHRVPYLVPCPTYSERHSRHINNSLRFVRESLQPSVFEALATVAGRLVLPDGRLNVSSWLRLVETARAADPDPWRNAVRDQYGRSAAETLPELRARAAEAQALEKQPVNSLLVLSTMLHDAGERRSAAAVIRVATKRFPRDFWVCMLQGALDLEGAPEVDPAGAIRAYTAAVALRPRRDGGRGGGSPIARNIDGHRLGGGHREDRLPPLNFDASNV